MPEALLKYYTKLQTVNPFEMVKTDSAPLCFHGKTEGLLEDGKLERGGGSIFQLRFVKFSMSTLKDERLLEVKHLPQLKGMTWKRISMNINLGKRCKR